MTIIDYQIREVLGLDVEKEDREVGILGNEFILVLKDEIGQQHQISFFDDEFLSLLDLFKPYVLERENQRKHEREYEHHLEELKNNKEYDNQ